MNTIAIQRFSAITPRLHGYSSFAISFRLSISAIADGLNARLADAVPDRFERDR